MNGKILLLLAIGLVTSTLAIAAKDAKVTHQVALTIAVDGKELEEKIVLGLFGEDTPKTAENFRVLCLEKRQSTVSQHTLSYVGSSFHRIIPNFMIQGGDFTNHNGTGGMSIYGNKFADENFQKKHDKKGLLSMANAGPNTNGSQFFLTFVECPWLNGAHCVFGECLNDIKDVTQFEKLGSKDGKPNTKIEIVNCGAL